MPTGDSLDIVLKVLGCLVPVVGGLAIWSVTKYVRLLHVEKETDQVRKDKDALAAQLAEARQQHEGTRLALTDRLDRVRAAYDEARGKFNRIKKAYLDLRDKGAEVPTAGEPAGAGDL